MTGEMTLEFISDTQILETSSGMILIHCVSDLRHCNIETLQSQEVGFNYLKLPLNFTHYVIYQTQ